MQVYNYVGPLYGGPLHAGDRATILISSYSDGTVNATVYEFDRLIPLAIVVALFIAAAVIVGGRTGATQSRNHQARASRRSRGGVPLPERKT